MQREINSLLTSLGITSNYKGFYYISQAVLLTTSGIEDLSLITKRLYPHIALMHNTSSKNVERNIRHAISIAWKTNPQLICKLAGRELKSRPTSSEFLTILTNMFAYK